MYFAHTFSKKLQFFFVFFNKDYTFYTKNLYNRPQKLLSKHFVQGKMQKVS